MSSKAHHGKLTQYAGALAVLSIVLIGAAYISAQTTISSTSIVVDHQTNICSTQINNDEIEGLAVHLTQASVDVFCVSYFYYNATSTQTMSTSGVLSIFGNEQVGSNGSQVVNDSSQFTITANPTQLQIGGPQSMNEGAIVIYSIGVKSGTPSGDYYLAINAVEYPQMVGCGSTLGLVVGDAQNTHGGGTCIAMPPNSSASSNGFLDGFLYFQVMGYTAVIAS